MINDGFIDYYSKMTKNDTWEVQQKVNQNLHALTYLSFEKLIFTPNGEIVDEKKFRADLKNERVIYLQNNAQINTPEQKIKDIAVFLKFASSFPGGVNHDDVMLVKDKLQTLATNIPLTSQSMAVNLSTAQIAADDLINKTTKSISEPKIDPTSLDGGRLAGVFRSKLEKQEKALNEQISGVMNNIRVNDKEAKDEVSSYATKLGLASWASWIGVAAFPIIGLAVPILAPLIFLAIPAFLLSIGLFVAYMVVSAKPRLEGTELDQKYTILIDNLNILKNEKVVLESIGSVVSNEPDEFITFCNKYDISSIREAIADPEKTKKLGLIFASESDLVQEKITDKTSYQEKIVRQGFVPTSQPSLEVIEQYRKELNLV